MDSIKAKRLWRPIEDAHAVTVPLAYNITLLIKGERYVLPTHVPWWIRGEIEARRRNRRETHSMDYVKPVWVKARSPAVTYP